jgi:hypothetical protein
VRPVLTWVVSESSRLTRELPMQVQHAIAEIKKALIEGATMALEVRRFSLFQCTENHHAETSVRVSAGGATSTSRWRRWRSNRPLLGRLGIYFPSKPVCYLFCANADTLNLTVCRVRGTEQLGFNRREYGSSLSSLLRP